MLNKLDYEGRIRIGGRRGEMKSVVVTCAETKKKLKKRAQRVTEDLVKNDKEQEGDPPERRKGKD